MNIFFTYHGNWWVKYEILWKIADENMQNPMLYRFHDKIGVKLYVFMYQGPIGTSPAHMIWKPSLNMATKLILVRQKLCYGYGYVHFSAYNCDKMIRVDPRCIFLGTKDHKELVQVM